MREKACILVLIFTILCGESVYSCENCLQNLNNKTDTCDVISGNCLYGCIQGFFGLNCSYNCPKTCMKPLKENESVCDFDTGECLHGCKDGYAGPTCSSTCPENCVTSETNTSRPCDEMTFDCLFGCKAGFYGNLCNESCSNFDEYCRECYTETYSSRPICIKCYKNFYRLNGKCVSCNYWCLPTMNSSLSVCNEYSGYCEFGCRPGRYGFQCDDRCSSSCVDFCDRHNGKCLTGCKYPINCGPACKENCNVGCLNQICNQSCECVQGCDKEHWGDICQHVCNKQCSPSVNYTNDRICDSSSGYCLYGCFNQLHWGNNCHYECSAGCVAGKCEQESGACTEGCKSNQFHGSQCNMSCGERCENKTCFRNGKCDQGCVAGSYGGRCHLSCNQNCLNETCKRESGFCNGCARGLYGNTCSLNCNKMCENGSCEQDSGYCRYTTTKANTVNQCERGGWFGQNHLYTMVAILGSGWASFLILLILFIVIICNRHCSPKVSEAKDEKSEITEPEKEVVKPKRRNQGDEYITLHVESCEVKNSFDNVEYSDLKADEDEAPNQRRDVVSYVNLGLKRIV